MEATESSSMTNLHRPRRRNWRQLLRGSQILRPLRNRSGTAKPTPVSRAAITSIAIRPRIPQELRQFSHGSNKLRVERSATRRGYLRDDLSCLAGRDDKRGREPQNCLRRGRGRHGLALRESPQSLSAMRKAWVSHLHGDAGQLSESAVVLATEKIPA